MSMKHEDPADPDRKRPYSIDLTLELERQLEAESQPPTPAHTARPRSLDPHVLASIVTQLRQSLTDVSRERDELLHQLSEAQSQESYLRETMQHLSEKCSQAQEELEAAQEKMKDDENAIAMLRTKVEESRRGLMRLQSENRRQTLAPVSIDTARAGAASLGPGPPSSRRASFNPLQLSNGSANRPIPGGHRRKGSLSDGAITEQGLQGLKDFLSLSPPSQAAAFPENIHNSLPPSTSRRFSGLFGSASPSEPAPDSTTVELKSLRSELRGIKRELDETKRELAESQEAREASESCVKVLREFIAEHNVGASNSTGETESIKLPPPPTMTNGDEVETSKAVAGGWGFGALWKGDTHVKVSPGPISPPVTSPTTAQLSRKIGSFFNSRASISSTTSSIGPQFGYEPRSVGSSASSVVDSVEPMSPPAGAGELPGANVKIRDGQSPSPDRTSADLEKSTRHVCPSCERAFATSAHLLRHLNLHHSAETEEVDLS